MSDEQKRPGVSRLELNPPVMAKVIDGWDSFGILESGDLVSITAVNSEGWCYLTDNAGKVSGGWAMARFEQVKP